jgi:hypothetical protein
MAAGMQAFNTGALQANQLKRQAQQDALREQLLMAQMQNYQSEAEQRKALAEARRMQMEQAQAQAEAQRRVLSQFSGPPVGFRDASIAQTGNAPAGYTPPQQRSVQVTPQMVAEFAAAGGDPALLKTIAESGNFGRPKVAREITVRGPDGNPRKMLVDDFGQPIGGGFDEPVKMDMVNQGDRFTPVNPYTVQGPLGVNMSPSEIASNQVARGNLGVAQANLGLSRERFAAEQRERAAAAAAGGGGFEYRQTPAGLIVVPKNPGAEGPVNARAVVDASSGAPLGGAANNTTQQRVADATDAIDIIAEAEKYIKDATGSFLGAGRDIAARAFGVSTTGAENAARLQAMEGMLVSKMPKMSGPQSDKDVLLYKQMAGQIGDPTIPTATKQAALETIKSLQRKYAGLPPEQPATRPAAGGASGGWSITRER